MKELHNCTATGWLPTSCKTNAPCIDIRGFLIIFNKEPLMLALLANIILQGLEGEFIKSVRQITKQKRDPLVSEYNKVCVSWGKK